MDFLPVNMDEAKARGWEQLDFVIVTADAYIDHPSFGTVVCWKVKVLRLVLLLSQIGKLQKIL